MISTDPETARLARRYRRLVSLVGAAVVLILAVLIAREFFAKVAVGLDGRLAVAGERLTAVEAVVQAADAHVVGMRAALERRLAAAAPARDPRIAAVTMGTDAVPVDLLGPPPSVDQPPRGTILVIPERAGRRGGFDIEAQAVSDLFIVQEAAHAGNPVLKWSYFFSAERDIVSIYPWLDIQADAPPNVSPLAVYDGYFDYDVYRMAEAAAASDGAAVWVPVYFDAGNAGLMVSHNAPVIVDGVFRGMIGTDVLLTVLSDRLQAAEAPDLSLVIVDQAGNVVADTARVAATATTVTAATGLLPVPLAAVQPNAFARHGPVYAAAFPVAGTPWTAVATVPAQAVGAEAMSEVLPYMVYLLVLTAMLTAAFFLIGRQFVKPAFELVRTIEQQALGAPAPAIAVPAAWRPWTERVLGLFGELHATVERLHRAEAKSAAIINVALDAVVTTRSDGTVVDFNPAAEVMFGIARADAVGRSIGDLIVPHHLREAHRNGMERYGRTRTPHVLGRRVELQALHGSGRVFPIEIQIHELPPGAEVSFAAYVRDLTEQRHVAAALKDQQEKLHQAEKLTAMGSLLAGLAHELNNPLAVVTAQTSLLEELAVDPPVRARATKIRTAAERCGRIVRTFLAMARKQTPQRVNVDVRAVMTGALEILAYGLASNGVAVRTRYDDDLPSVEADPDQISQVFINMLVNAQQAFGDRTADRSIEVEVARRGGLVAVTIADNGPGIPEALKARIFEPFFTTKPVGVGTGIGLAVSRSIIEAHGGRIEAGERPGGGARFTILLPTGDQRIAAPAPSLPAGDPTAPAEESGRPVLVVDDEHEVADSLAGFLELDGLTVTMAHSIAEGLEAIAATPFDAVFCDLRMPGGGGTALWAEVARRDPALADRFIFVTGDMVAGPETVRLASAGRPVRVLEKPFDRAAIRAALEAIVPGGTQS